MAPVLGQLGMLEEDDVVIGARGGDRIPHARERVLEVVGLEHDLELADVVGLGNLSVGEHRGQLGPRLEIARRAVVQHEHPDGVWLGHARNLDALRDERAQALGDLDVLFVPVGSGPTIGADQAAEIAARLRATIVVPMHYRTDRIDFLEPVDAFAQRAARVERFASPTFETEALPAGEGPLVVIPAPP
jgi:L-ascorbate metabolism protein UlaG (beta-lactamase superfamily)